MLDLTETNSKSTDSHNELKTREVCSLGTSTGAETDKLDPVRRTRKGTKKQESALLFGNYSKRVNQLKVKPIKSEDLNNTENNTKLAATNLLEPKPVKKFYSSRSNQANVSNNSANTSQTVQKLEQSVKHPLEGEDTHVAKKPRLLDDMLNNGYRTNDAHNNQNKSDDMCTGDYSPIATLLNIGNTCYLNSVIYTLRFTPFFLHNLHHLVDEITQVSQKLNLAKVKSSSLGRNIGGISGSSSRSWSNKDLPALGNQNDANPKSSIQIASEKLHELFQSLRSAEIKDNIEPFQADTFLRSVQEVNTIFEGNQQQDAHELLMCVLDIIRETCSSLSKKVANEPDLFNGCSSLTETPEDISSSANHGKYFFNKKLRKRSTSKQAKSNHPAEAIQSPPTLQNGLGKNSSDDETSSTGSTQKQRQIGFDFVTQDFQGVTVSKTTCLTCETVTERKQPMCDIPVPILEEGPAAESASKLYQHACVTSEYLRDQNKYFCEECLRYCEARRSVSFDVLPRLLILQLKRFSGGMEKISTFVPTPLTLSCFCNKCCDLEDHQRLHRYKLYSIISHVGATMSVGHYIAYTRALDLNSDYIDCDREKLSKPLSSTNTTTEKSTAFKKMFSRTKSSCGSSAEKIANGSVSAVSCCPGLGCCGIKFNKLTRANDEHNNSVFGNENDSVWFVCDDERVKQISASEFEDLISNSNMKQTATPYLLFYVKSDIK